MRPTHLFIAVFLLILLSGCASGKLQAPQQGDPPGTERYSQFCLVLDARSGFTRCETNEVVCYLGGSTQTCALKPAPAPQSTIEKPLPKKK